MKTSLALIIAASLATATAIAQQSTVQGDASAESRTAVSADRRGANAASETGAQAGISAQETDAAGRQAAADVGGTTEMSATLERSVDARRAKPGDEVTAKTRETFTTASGVSIPRGSRLVGRVTEARAHGPSRSSAQGAAASQLGIVFDKAELPDGRVVPMHATIQAIAAAQSSAEGGLTASSRDAHALGSAHAAGGGFAGAGLGGAVGGLGSAGGGIVGSAGAGVGSATSLPPRAVGAASASSHAAGAANAHGSALAAASAGAVGGLSASGQWLGGSRGVFGLRDTSIASAASGSGSLITSPSRNVRLDGGTQLLVVGNVGTASR